VRVSVRRSRVLGVLAVAAAAGGVAWVTWPRAAVVIEIAPGGVATVAGSPLPETLFVKARGRSTVIRVVNRDTLRHQLALFGADPGETRNYTIAYPGTYGGVCSTHPTGNLTYVVR
jgi:hypothetical protein